MPKPSMVERTDERRSTCITVARSGSVRRLRKLSSSLSRDTFVVTTVGSWALKSVVQHLEEFFASPRAASLRSKIVQHEQRNITHLLEKLVVCHIAIRAEGGPEVVKQIWHYYKERPDMYADAMVRYGRREVRLPASTVPRKYKPTPGLCGVALGRLVSSKKKVFDYLPVGYDLGASVCRR